MFCVAKLEVNYIPSTFHRLPVISGTDWKTAARSIRTLCQTRGNMSSVPHNGSFLRIRESQSWNRPVPVRNLPGLSFVLLTNLKAFLPTRQNPRAHCKNAESYSFVFGIALYLKHCKGRKGIIFDSHVIDLLPTVRQITFCFLSATDLFPCVFVS